MRNIAYLDRKIVWGWICHERFGRDYQLPVKDSCSLTDPVDLFLKSRYLTRDHVSQISLKLGGVIYLVLTNEIQAETMHDFGIQKWYPFSTISSLPAGWILMPRLTLEDLFLRGVILNNFMKHTTTLITLHPIPLRTTSLKYYVHKKQIFIILSLWNLRIYLF